jgi:hypothetical protein
MGNPSRFQAVVSQRGASLRALSFTDLLSRAKTPPETFRLGWRTATITLVIEQRTPDLLRVIVQGLLRFPSWSPVSTVAVDGFYKSSDGTLQPVSENELDDFS